MLIPVRISQNQQRRFWHRRFAIGTSARVKNAMILCSHAVSARPVKQISKNKRPRKLLAINHMRYVTTSKQYHIIIRYECDGKSENGKRQKRKSCLSSRPPAKLSWQKYFHVFERHRRAANVSSMLSIFQTIFYDIFFFCFSLLIFHDFSFSFYREKIPNFSLTLQPVSVEWMWE